MTVFSTAAHITQGFKNAGRVTEIVSVLVKHGFADLVSRIGLSRFLPAKLSENPRYQQLPTQQRLRLSFEELGPTFVKLGQLLAARPDLIPEAYIEEFQKLQDRVGTVKTSEIKRFVEQELRKPISEFFSEFEEQPIAAASIAQVHGATLKTGEKVAVKIQRPGIERIIHNDISILRGLALLLEKYIPEFEILNPTGIVEEFFQTILYELDFVVEANNIRRIKKNMEPLNRIAIPNVYTHISTHRVLVLERFDGVRFSDRERILNLKISPTEMVELGCEAFFKMVMQDGLFHGDLHAGNLFVLPDNRIGIIDFGIVGRLPRRVREGIISIFISLIEEDFETLAAEYLSLCQVPDEIDLTLLQKDLMDAISPYIGMALGEVNIGHVLLRSTTVATRHRLKVPRELMLLFKAIFTIEGLGKALDPGFDLLGLGNRLAKQMMRIQYSKERLLRDLWLIGRDAQALIETGPRLLNRFLQRWSKNGFALELRNKDTEKLAQSVDRFSRVLLGAILSIAAFAFGITFLFLRSGPMIAGLPVMAVVPSVTGFLIILFTLFSIRHK